MRKLLAFLGALLLASPVWATDGDPCSDAQTAYSRTTRGGMRALGCVVLCDGKTGTADCTEYDMNTWGANPDVLSFMIYETGACTVGTITLGSAFESGLTVASDNAYALGSPSTLTVDSTTKLDLDTRLNPHFRYILASTSGMTCAGGLDILLVGWEEREDG